MRVQRTVLLALLVAGLAFARADGPGKGPDPALVARIQALIQELASPTWKVREKATADLVAIGEPAVPYLRTAMDSHDLETRWRAKEILIKLGALVDPKLLEQVKKLLEVTVDERQGAAQRAEAERALVALGGEKVLPAFFLVLHEKDYRLRRHVTELAPRFPNHQAVTLLIKALADTDPFVRSGAASSLRSLTGKAFPSWEPEKWQAWWKEHGKGWKPPVPPVRR